jgi:hypothetical protein
MLPGRVLNGESLVVLTRRATRGAIVALALLLPIAASLVVASAGAARHARAADRLAAHVQPASVARELVARPTSVSAAPRVWAAWVVALLALVLALAAWARRRPDVRYARPSRAPPGLRSV